MYISVTLHVLFVFFVSKISGRDPIIFMSMFREETSGYNSRRNTLMALDEDPNIGLEAAKSILIDAQVYAHCLMSPSNGGVSPHA